MTARPNRGVAPHLFVLIDALGWELLRGRAFLDRFLPHRMPLRTVLGYSAAAIPTLLTGRDPAAHGRWNLYYYDPAGSPFRFLRAGNWLPERWLDHRLGRKLLQQTGRKLLGLGPGFECCLSPRLLPWFNWCEKRSLYAPGALATVPTIFDDYRGAGLRVASLSYRQGGDRELIRRAARAIAERRAEVVFLYLSELDGDLHLHRRDPQFVAARLNWYEEQLTPLVEAALAPPGGGEVCVFSDHGMAPVERRFDLAAAVAGRGLCVPGDYLAVYDSTMARFWMRSPRARRELPELLASLSAGRLLSQAELEQLGVWFADQRYGEAIFLLHPRTLLATSDFHGRRWMPSGMHGYHPNDPDSDAIFLSHRPPPATMRTIADIHAILRRPLVSHAPQPLAAEVAS